MRLTDLASGLLDLIYPPRCPGCAALTSAGLCAACLGGLVPVVSCACEKCGDPSPPGHDPRLGLCDACAAGRGFDGARAAFAYEGALRAAIRSLKFGRRRDLGPVLGGLLVGAVAAAMRGDETGGVGDIPLESIDLVAPVPLHPTRERRRGFNHAALLAEPVAALLGAKLDARLLKRTRPTLPQPGLSPSERARNVQGAFAAVPADDTVRGACVLLVDDLVTTGSTMSECSRALRKHGVVEVWGLALARPIHADD